MDVDRVCRLDPLQDDHAYFLGLLATDGHIAESTRNRGRVSFELSAIDGSILRTLAARIPYRAHLSVRQRTTNFARNHISVVLNFHDLQLRHQLRDLGFGPGRKSSIIAPPRQPYNERGFWRGVLDGDGSLGMTGQNRPFVSLVTASETLRNAYVDFMHRTVGARPNPQRNQRDRVYNIVVFTETALQIVAELYSEDMIAIPRKLEAARFLSQWRRPPGSRRRTFECRRWSEEEDAVVLGGDPLATIAVKLRRTTCSVNLRRWRLRHRVARTPQDSRLFQD